jgi:hypothetical protein
VAHALGVGGAPAGRPARTISSGWPRSGACPGWFDAPICLFNEIESRWAAEPADAPLNDAEREALLSVLLAEHAVGLLGGTQGYEAWVPAVDRFIGEVVAEGISVAELRRALDATATDAPSRARAAVLGTVFAEWEAALARERRVDGRDAKVRLARVIAEDPEGFAMRLGKRREIRLVGLADLRGGWRPLLRALESVVGDRPRGDPHLRAARGGVGARDADAGGGGCGAAIRRRALHRRDPARRSGRAAARGTGCGARDRAHRGAGASPARCRRARARGRRDRARGAPLPSMPSPRRSDDSACRSPRGVAPRSAIPRRAVR